MRPVPLLGTSFIFLTPDADFFEVGVDHVLDFFGSGIGLHGLVAISHALKAPTDCVEPFFHEPPRVAFGRYGERSLSPTKFKCAEPPGDRPHRSSSPRRIRAYGESI